MGRVASYTIPANPNEFVGVNVKGHTRFSAFEHMLALIHPSPNLMIMFAYEPSNFQDNQFFTLTPFQVFNSWVVCDYVFPYEQSSIVYFKLAQEGKAPVILSVHTEIDIMGDGF
jgi:hypothetical protein